MPRRSRWPTTASRAWTPTSCASSTPTGRACAPTTGARSPPSSARRSRRSRSRSSATGSQTRSFCFVSDLVEGFLRLIDCDHHEPVNLGNPGEFTILELAELLIELTGSSSKIVYEALPQDDPAVRQPDIGLARELLGWEPDHRAARGPGHHPARDGRGGAASQLTRPSGPGGSPRATARSGRSTASICASSSGSASASWAPTAPGRPPRCACSRASPRGTGGSWRCSGWTRTASRGG